MSPQDQLNGHDANNPNDRHLFGLNQKGYSPLQDFNNDYEQKYPEVPVFEEMGPNARVWRMYLAESSMFDDNMVGEARDGLDAMLVFAGPPSAVVTTFVVQTSQSLQPEVDYTQVSASLLSELVFLLRAAASGSPLNSIPTSSLPLNAMTPTHNILDIWVNGLWVISLSLSLVVALASILVKQWLRRYLAIHSGTPKHRSRIRHFRYVGFERWGVLNIVGSLPVIMYLSLAFFFVGLVLFLIPLQLVLSCIIGAVALIGYALYLFMNILPIFDPQCPYQTPLSDFILTIWITLSAFRNLSAPDGT
ncbi:hypothetical protein F5051DRAFT_61632 [Lentinula edodes]|nr:hypothetical protein F5051DRAFT_61632 [Lentinula edodes]